MNKPIIGINLGGGSTPENNQVWFYGRVVTTKDPFNAQRIKVRIAGIDNTYDNDDKILEDDTNWVTPFLPMHSNVVPKVGETVRIIMQDPTNPYINRCYFGPTISQKQNLEFDPHYFTSRAGTNQGLTKLKKSWVDFPDTREGDWAIFPENEDIQLHGRGNTDIILRKKEGYDEILLRTAKWDYNDKLKLNKKNPAYITINHSRPIEVGSKSEREQKNLLNLEDDRTHINIVSDNVNLISHKGSTIHGELPKIISGDISKQLEAEEKLHPLVYGDLFWEFVGLVRNYVTSHIHIGDRLVSDPSGPTLALNDWIQRNRGNTVENSNFLSKGVKTN
jgi:hypothetical protein